MILVDPKRVELGQYNRLPHLLTQVVTNPKKAANALAWTVGEMERRYDLLSEVGVRDIVGYNAAFDRGELGGETLGGPAPGSRPPAGGGGRAALPPPALHPGRGRRAQRPDDGGRPRRRGLDLPHRADGPCGRHPPRDRHPAPVGQRDHRRHQGEHPVPHRLRRVVPGRQPGHPRPAGGRAARRPGRHAAAGPDLVGSPADPGRVGHRGGGPGRRRPLAPPEPRRRLRRGRRGRRRRAPRCSMPRAAPAAARDDEDDNALLVQARELVVRSQLGSTSMLQRKLRVGFARAGRLMDLLEQQGVVGPSTGSKARDVLMTPEELGSELSDVRPDPGTAVGSPGDGVAWPASLSGDAAPLLGRDLGLSQEPGRLRQARRHAARRRTVARRRAR